MRETLSESEELLDETTLHNLADLIEKEFGLRRGTITGRSKERPASLGRMAFCHIATKKEMASFSSIGRYLNIHHTSASYAYRNFKRLLAKAPEYQAYYETVCNKMRVDSGFVSKDKISMFNFWDMNVKTRF